MKLIDKSKHQVLFNFPNGDYLLVNTKEKLTEHFHKEDKKDRAITAKATFNLFKYKGF